MLAADSFGGRGLLLLLELVDDVVDVIADNKQSGDCGNNLRDSHQRLNPLNLGEDRLLLAILLAIQSFMQEELIVFVATQPRTV